MECTFYALLACFSWSNVYVDGGLQFNDYPTPRIEWRQYQNDTGAVLETVRYQVIVNQRENPYGRIAFGYEMPFQNATLRLEASHISSFATDNDRGLDAISINLRWFPFRH